MKNSTQQPMEKNDYFLVTGSDSVLISKQKGRKIEHFNN